MEHGLSIRLLRVAPFLQRTPKEQTYMLFGCTPRVPAGLGFLRIPWVSHQRVVGVPVCTTQHAPDLQLDVLPCTPQLVVYCARRVVFLAVKRVIYTRATSRFSRAGVRFWRVHGTGYYILRLKTLTGRVRILETSHGIWRDVHHSQNNLFRRNWTGKFRPVAISRGSHILSCKK